MTSSATTVTAYLAELPAAQREAVAALRKVILRYLPDGFEEQMQYGMIGYVVPHRLYPAGYHCKPQEPLPFMHIAAQKNSVNFYHMGLYADGALMHWFTTEHARVSPKKPDMGKSCIRYKKPEDIPYALLGELAGKMSVDAWIQLYESAFRKGSKK